MDDKEKALDRFKAKPEELKVIFRPQCIDCRKNINRESCEVFANKPIAYCRNKNESVLTLKRDNLRTALFLCLRK